MAVALVAMLAVACGGDGAPAACADSGPTVTYEDVKPVFARCVRCHSTENVGDARNGAPGYINLNTYEEIAKIPNQAVRAMGNQVMPPVGEKVPRCEWMLVEKWIAGGLKR